MVLSELVRLGPSIPPHGELLLLLMQKKPTLVPDSEAFNYYIGEGFLIPKLKDGSEASKEEQADSSSENNVGNGALCVIGLHRSGDAIALFLQDWVVAKVALSCQKALDMLCQELHDVERRRGWLDMEQAHLGEHDMGRRVEPHGKSVVGSTRSIWRHISISLSVARCEGLHNSSRATFFTFLEVDCMFFLRIATCWRKTPEVCLVFFLL